MWERSTGTDNQGIRQREEAGGENGEKDDEGDTSHQERRENEEQEAAKMQHRTADEEIGNTGIKRR
jgi:hypothetical protein